MDLKPGTQLVFDYGPDHATTKKCVASCVLCNQQKTGHNLTLHEDPEHDDASAQDVSDPYEFRGSGEIGEDANAKAPANDKGSQDTSGSIEYSEQEANYEDEYAEGSQEGASEDESVQDEVTSEGDEFEAVSDDEDDGFYHISTDAIME